jgi:hypothetical protein
MIDHDQIFKELLTHFFREFVELFFPEVAAYMDRDAVEFLDKEVFTDVTAGERHEVDLVVKTRFRGEATFFLIHVENQAHAQGAFGKRMFRYFARLHEKHDLPVYPIALLSYDAPQRAEPTAYVVQFPDKRVLEFNFAVVQLNRLNWRDFVRSSNPIASALMAKMDIAPADRPRVKMECLRLLATLRLDVAKMQLIGGFLDTYLRLNAEEEETLRREMNVLDAVEKETVMQITTSWERKGKRDLLVKQLRYRFGDVALELEGSIDALADERIDDFAQALLSFSSIADARAWLEQASR